MTAQRQRGAALIAAVLVVALAVVLVAALLDRGEAARARTRNALRAEQGWQLMLGLEAWAASALRSDERYEPGVDSRSDLWAQPLPPLELPGATIRGRLREIGGCLNLNALVRGDQDDPVVAARFERLLRVLGLDPDIAAQVSDWIDPDLSPRSGGTEDAALLARSPPSRAANRPMTHVSELRILPAVDAASYDALLPHVCVLPPDTPMNLNTASVALWMSLSDDIGAGDAQRLARDGQARYLSLDQVEQELDQLGIPRPPWGGSVGVTSSHFVVEAEIEADGVPFLYASLLQRRPEGVRVVARTRGGL